MKLLTASLLFFISVTISLGQPNKKPDILILGTYHMATTTSNVVNTEIDDIKNPERQKQLDELINKLAQYKPTKIMVESRSYNQEKLDKKLADYLAGNYELTRNETDQIGLRLAKKLNIQKIYAVDRIDPLPVDSTYNYEKFAESRPEVKAYLKKIYEDLKNEVETDVTHLRTLTVTEQMIFLNSQEHIANDHQRYFRLLDIVDDDIYAGANYLSWWYGRNLKIFTNIKQKIDSNEDRILVIYGNGHNYLLTQMAEESGMFNVVSPMKYLK
ncbi:DUF5694 domain-containing protein [Fulvivirga lutea]|uniref:Uncharacterized protein n=1 Tax=Fulvivirga lutea TaxID=2810512 RepID=A0A975A320_9BACT|nr:DUF5694 domain-containing protein [Fulvivirga lutea]QSE99147.1 hypothetical protein JR347_08680 [Fulvivirga lutea]